MLEAVQDEEFRKAMELGAHAKYIEDQMVVKNLNLFIQIFFILR